MKTCFKCGETKNRSEFYAHPQMSDGLLGKCKECTKKDYNERAERKRDYIAEYEKKRSKTPERKKKVIEYQRKRRKRNPEKDRARRALAYALKSGKIVKPTSCSMCGCCNKIQGHHHNGYSLEHALDVQWLCFKCHREHGHKQKCN